MYSISIIVPFYNGECYINNIFNCIYSQTFDFEDIELILVDDDSSDNTWKKITNFSKEYHNVKSFKVSEENPQFTNHFPGAGISRNIGILKATGQYIMFLDQDDSMEKNSIETLFKVIDKNKVDFVKSNYSLLINEVKYPLSIGNQKYIKINPHDKKMKALPNDMVWGCIYNRKFLIENDIKFPGGLGEDSFFIAQCLTKTKKDFIIINDFYSVIYTSDNQNSYSHDYNNVKLSNHIQNQEKIMEMYVKNNFHKKFLKSVFKLFCLNQMSNVLRSSENYTNKKNMIIQVSDFFSKNEEYTPKLPFYWHLLYSLFINKHTILLQFTSLIINAIFNRKFLIPIQNKIRQKGWNDLK